MKQAAKALIRDDQGKILVLSQEDLRYSWQTDWGERQFLYEVGSLKSAEIVVSWEHHSHNWLTVGELINHPATCLFMHRVQNWLKQRV